VIRAARNVAERALTYSRFAQHTQPALINGVPGPVTAVDGKTLSGSGSC
jgi:RNA polymerase sigma-70 factor (ECF subfamily)